jgi:peptidoglycan/LPS O-acetylase OafA/YrhL
MNKRIVALDGLRGFACLVVVVAHYFGETQHHLPCLALGWAGVELFFCLSGFLIGGILLDNRESPSYFRTFYLRRALRIFPIYYVCITLVLLIHPDRLAIFYYTYTGNIAMVASGFGSEWLKPTWTLCVEEQFYMLLPLLLYVVPARWLVRVIVTLIVLPMVLRHHGVGPILLTDRMDALLMGVLAAYAIRNPAWSKWLTCNNRRALKALTLVAIALIPLAISLDVFDIFGWTATAGAFTGLILLIVDGSQEAARFRSPVLCWFGTISYCLYLIHQPIAGILHGLILGSHPDLETLAQAGVSVLAIAVSVGIAALSWYLFERPLLRYGQRFTYGNALTSTLGSRTITA